MNPSTATALWAPLLQYGAIGAMLAIFLAVFVKMFHKLMDNLITQNKALGENQAAQLKSLHAIELSNTSILSAVKQLDLDQARRFYKTDDDYTMPTRVETPRSRTVTQPEVPSRRKPHGG